MSESSTTISISHFLPLEKSSFALFYKFFDPYFSLFPPKNNAFTKIQWHALEQLATELQ
jgi:hypothetical protein